MQQNFVNKDETDCRAGLFYLNKQAHTLRSRATSLFLPRLFYLITSSNFFPYLS